VYHDSTLAAWRFAVVTTPQDTLNRTINAETYRGVPPLAGLCSLAEASRPGLSIEECVRRLKRYHYAFKRLHQIFTARITAEPIYELKTAFSHHAYLCAEHTAAVARRVAELREPPLGLDDVPDANLAIFFDEILTTSSTHELLLGLYEKALPALTFALSKHVADANPLFDAPSVRLCRIALLELGDMNAFGEQAVAALVDEKTRTAAEEWLTFLDECWSAAGGQEGTDDLSPAPLPRRRSAEPPPYDAVPKRDERFIDPYNAGVNAEAFLYDPRYPARAKTLMMFYKRLREIDVPEMMATIIHETKGKPLDYYLEMSRQLWDEARHAMMGQVGFVAHGLDWTRIPINFTWSRNLNTQLSALERHAVLFFIEQGLMPRTGKRFEWETATKSGDALSARIQDYDWADEVLHSQIGRRWYVTQMPNLNEAMQYGDRCWTKIVSHWQRYLVEGLTQHRNWWPELYRAACARWRIEPDAQALAFAETYEAKRADLQELPASG
jgi:hypothetical protein